MSENSRAHDEGGGYAACRDCGRRYGDEFGFPDLVLPPSDWQRISPTYNDGGLLCPSCMCCRAHAAGLTNVPARFTSGPFCAPDDADYRRLNWMEADAIASRKGHGPYHTLRYSAGCWRMTRSLDSLNIKQQELYNGPSLREALDAARSTPDKALLNASSSLHTPSSPKEME